MLIIEQNISDHLISVAKEARRIIGIYPELKTPEFFKQEIPDFNFSQELANVLAQFRGFFSS